MFFLCVSFACSYNVFPMFSYVFLLFSKWFSWALLCFSHARPMLFLCFSYALSYAFLLLCLCFSFGVLLVLICFSYVSPLLFLCCSFAFPMLFPCLTYAFLKFVFNAFPMSSPCFSYAFPIRFLFFSWQTLSKQLWDTNSFEKSIPNVGRTFTKQCLGPTQSYKVDHSPVRTDQECLW